jgi:hypothetical protein
MSMVETDKDGNVVRTIATGADEKAFMQDLNAAMDPASLMEYSMNLADMNYKKGITALNEAQAEAALKGKPLTLTEWATQVARDPNASPTAVVAAGAVIFKDNPEAAQNWANLKLLNSNVKNIKGDGDDGGVTPKVAPTVTLNAPTTEQEQTSASSIMEILANPSSTAQDRAAALAGTNRILVEKYFGSEALELEDNKSELTAQMADDILKGDVTLTPAGLEELANKYQTQSQRRAGQGGNAAGRKRNEKFGDFAKMIRGDAPGLLQIVISDLSSKITTLNRGGRNGLNQGARNAKIEARVADMQRLIETMLGR